MTCFICKRTFSVNFHLITHLNIIHDPKSLSELKCLEPNCFRVLTNLHSFKKHLTQHNNILDISRNIPSIANDSHNTLVLDSACLPILNKIIPSSSKYNSKSITIDTFINTLNYSSVTLASKWYNNSIIPRKIIQVLFSDIQQFNNSFISLLKEKLLEITIANSKS